MTTTNTDIIALAESCAAEAIAQLPTTEPERTEAMTGLAPLARDWDALADITDGDPSDEQVRDFESAFIAAVAQ